MKPLAWVIVIVAGLVAVWWGIEMALLAISRHRLRTGDGREHSFRHGSPKT